MYLEKLDVQGFKSFAPKTSLDFGKGITAIVGPNGSGKSNIADAIRWVLGEQSLKTIRGKRSEDVIFAGSDKKTRLGVAEVSLYLNNEDRTAPIDFSELVITRRVYRSGEGEYLVNKRPVRLSDIHMLLAKSNFGQRTYSIIGQGMVDSILLTSPQERKSYFDEAAGVRQYQLKRDQAISKLDRTRENLRQAEVLIQEIEPRLRSLTRQVRRLERRTEVEKELIVLQTRFYRGTLQHFRKQLSEAQGNLATLNGERKKHERIVNEMNARIAALEGEQSRSEAFAALQRQYEQAQAEKGVLLAEEAVLRGQRDAAFARQGKANIVWLEKQLGSVVRQIADLETEITGLQGSLDLERSKQKTFSAEEDQKRKEYESLDREVRGIYEVLQKGVVSLPDVQTEFQEFVAFEHIFIGELRNATTVEQLDTLRKRGDELEKRTSRLADRLERLGASEKAEKVVALQERLAKALGERDDIIRRSAEVSLSVRLRSEKVQLLTRSLDRLREERDRLDRELARSKAGSVEDATETNRTQTDTLTAKIAAVNTKLSSITAEMQQFNQSETKKRNELFQVQRELRTAQDNLNAATGKCSDVKVEVARLETHVQDVEREIRDEVNEEAWKDIFESTEQTPQPKSEDSEEIQRIKHQLGLIGGIDEGIEKEYYETDERYRFLKTQYDDLMKASAQLEAGIEELDVTIKERFDEAFKKINEEFGKFFRSLFSGGSAKLILIKDIIQQEDEEENEEGSEDDEEEADGTRKEKEAKGEKVIIGIEIQATPPGKRLKGIGMLSGGERALTSIALICAIIKNNPSPFVVLDEVDAALDEANSQRFAAILVHLATHTQFVTITHNRATMEKANILYGVTMGDDGVSKLLSVKLEEAERVIKKFGNR
ncbi:MAG: AAA family ATPase [Candidatus Kerfeldbacteria bacterium]